MVCNSLMANKVGSHRPQQTENLKPGNYDLGSLESRAAARALLDAKSAGEQEKLRVFVHVIGSPVTLEMTTCSRYRSRSNEADKDLLVEIIHFDGAEPTDGQAEQLAQWIRKVPIDGQTYKFGDVGND
jgi:hypothetical protein